MTSFQQWFLLWSAVTIYYGILIQLSTLTSTSCMHCIWSHVSELWFFHWYLLVMVESFISYLLHSSGLVSMRLVSSRDVTGNWKSCRCFEAEPHNNDIRLGENWMHFIIHMQFVYTISFDWMMLFFQGGNNIHAKGVTAIAQMLKDNSVITTVSITFRCLHIGNRWYDTRSPNKHSKG